MNMIPPASGKPLRPKCETCYYWLDAGVGREAEGDQDEVRFGTCHGGLPTALTMIDHEGHETTGTSWPEPLAINFCRHHRAIDPQHETQVAVLRSLVEELQERLAGTEEPPIASPAQEDAADDREGVGLA